METVDVVIKIPKTTYNNVKKTECIIWGDDAYYIGHAIANGTVLPKGHGRLVDADEMVKILRKSEYYQEKRGDFYGVEVTSRVKNFIEDTDTVIEADKEVEHDD